MSDKRVIKAALLGAGVVGSGVYELAQILAEDIEYKTGAALEIKKVLVRNLNKKREGIAEEVLTDNWKDIVEDPEIDIVIELMGGIEPARTYILEAIAAGKQVVTANKDLLAEDGRELLEASDAAGTDLLFEASVGGAIPIIRPLKQSMAGDNITEIMGIVNGTTNYILTKMSEKGMGYEDALRQATELGYAESDPTADVEGYDACRKIAILSSLAYERYFDFEDIYTEGITKITPEDMEYAAKLGRTIKLLGTSRRLADGTCYAMVAPFMLGQNSPLYSVNDVFNAVFVHGNMLGDAMFYGSGAGKLPTASAVVGDIVDAAKHLHVNIVTNWNSTPAVLKPLDEVTGRFFVRIKKEAAEEAKKVFGDVEIISLGQLPQECAFITDEMTQGAFEEKLAQIGDQVLAKIRVKD